VPELSYCIVLCPQVLGAAEAGTALLMAKASATASVILDNMIVLLV
jgi:hypothetical protein